MENCKLLILTPGQTVNLITEMQESIVYITAIVDISGMMTCVGILATLSTIMYVRIMTVSNYFEI